MPLVSSRMTGRCLKFLLCMRSAARSTLSLSVCRENSHQRSDVFSGNFPLNETPLSRCLLLCRNFLRGQRCFSLFLLCPDYCVFRIQDLLVALRVEAKCPAELG